jgi:hypothetical protein
MTSLDQEFVEEFERLMQEVEQIIQEYPVNLQPALRDEARVAFRLQLQQRWEAWQAQARGAAPEQGDRRA